MKTALDDKLLMPNLDLPISKEDFLNLVRENNNKVQTREIGKREVIQISHKIFFIESPGYSLEGPSQQIKYVTIIPSFDNTGFLKSQKIMLDELEFSQALCPGYEILEPFLASPHWELIKKEENPNIKGLEGRNGKYLLENESVGLILIYNEGRSLDFTGSQSRDFIMNNKLFWDNWGRTEF